MASTRGGVLTKSKVNNHAVSVQGALNGILDGEGYRRRFNDLMGARSAQFISSIISVVNANKQLQAIAKNNPITIIQACLRAAVYDLPIDPSLGFAYILPFGNEASFIMGYKGLIQLGVRSSQYETINAIAIHEGELKSFNRLTEEIEFDFIEDTTEREKTPIIGYCGYFKLITGYRKIIYKTKDEIKAHELKHRKGKYMSQAWRENFDAMALKTVLRELLSKWGILSIDIQSANSRSKAIAEALAGGNLDDEYRYIDEQPQQIEDITQNESENTKENIQTELKTEDIPDNVDPETGEIKDNAK